jgi:hypothetical protein
MSKILNTINLSVVFLSESLFLTLREEHKLKAFENRVLKGLFGPMWDEITISFRKLDREKFRNLYSSPNIIRTFKSRRMRWAGNVARVGAQRNAVRVLGGKARWKETSRKT